MKKTSPGSIWKKLRKDSIPAIGEQFWDDISSIVPVSGPRLDAFIDRDQFVVVMELPGVSSGNQLRLSVRGHTLFLRGEIPYVYPVEDDRLAIAERFPGTFQRSVELPSGFDPQSIRAKLEFGLLTVTIALSEEREWNVAIEDPCNSKEKGNRADGQIDISGSSHPGSEQIVGRVHRTQPANPLEEQPKGE